ncbi:MAG: tetratricopeptide repeat protein, partial [Candidatus Sumerlaeota bacterium]|nr:tetratricopeptide repeat protein [Candidatus Sumerlaeota bacterium]
MAIKSLADPTDPALLARLAGFLDDPRRYPRLEAIAAANRAAPLLAPEVKARFDQRRHEFIDSLAGLPDDPTAHYNLGNFYADAGEQQLALQQYQTAQALGMDPAVALWTNLGSLLAAMGKRDEAEQTLQRAVAEDPRFAEGYFNLGLFYGEQADQLGKAITNLKKAVELRPDWARAQYNLGLAYNQAGRVREATLALEKALRADSRLFDAAYALSTIYLRQGDMKEAREAARRALAINPDSPEAA